MSEQNCPWCGYGTWNGKVCVSCGAKETEPGDDASREAARRMSVRGPSPIKPRAVTPPRNFRPPHPMETCQCDTCIAWRTFRAR